MYCSERQLDEAQPSVAQVLNFLSDLFTKGLSYSAINAARSALSSFIKIEGYPAGAHPTVIRLLRGVFNERPALPKTGVTWDVELLLNFLKTVSPAHSLSLLDLSIKAVTLLLILTGHRGQNIQFIDLRNLSVSNDEVRYRYGDLLKTTRPGHHQREVRIRAYTPDCRLCVCTILKEYLERTSAVRGDITALFITSQKPHKAVSRSTISRWFKRAMQAAGVDTSIFTAHSVRSASTSKAALSQVSIKTILATAGWSRATTFSRYYERPIVDAHTFSDAIMGVNNSAQ